MFKYRRPLLSVSPAISIRISGPATSEAATASSTA